MKKYTYEFVKEQFEKEGYRLLSEEYINNRQKLDYICPKGHVHSITYHKWSLGRRCRKCAFEYTASLKRLNFKDIKNNIEAEGYKLVSTKYENNHSQLECICPNNHKIITSWNKWQIGYRCARCSIKVKSENQRLPLDYIKECLEKEGYTLLEYTDSMHKLIYICPNGHYRTTTWGSWQQGRRCYICRSMHMMGNGNHQWKGGISFEPYCEIWADKEYKKSIKERDGYRCLNSYCASKNPNDLTIHHIDYNKKNCGPDNLITLCRSCNTMANYNRGWHEDFYQIIMSKKYKYNYEEE